MERGNRSPESSPAKNSPPSSPPLHVNSSPLHSSPSLSPPPPPSPTSSPILSDHSSPGLASPSSPVEQENKRRKLEVSESTNAKEPHCRVLFDEEAEQVLKETDNGNNNAGDAGGNSFENNQQILAEESDILEVETGDVGDKSSMVEVEVSMNVQSSSSSEDELNSSESSSCGEESESSSEEEKHSEEESSSESGSESSGGESSDDDSERFVSPKVYEGSDLTVDEGVLSLMNLFTKHKMSKNHTGDVLKVTLKFIPRFNNMPKTQYSLFNYVKKLCPVSEPKVHFYCSKCLYYLGLVERECNLCAGKPHKFYQLSLVEQIRNLFEQHGLADIIDEYMLKRNSAPENLYSDLLDGSMFKRAKRDGKYDLTLMGHTDGISISDSSSVSLWPLEWVIAQLPPYHRFKFVLMSGIWVDSCKPYMNTLMKPFAEELNDLSEHGVQWTHPRTKELHVTYVTVPCFCCDAPVRAQLQNILIHGGRYCCHFCERKMKKLPPEPEEPEPVEVQGKKQKKKKKRRRVFTFETKAARLRTSEAMEEQGTDTLRRQVIAGDKPVKATKGVKGPSVISNIPGCDRSVAVFPEYMHLLLCVVKHFMNLWFNVRGPWSLQDSFDIINYYLLSIRVPDFITRISRSAEKFSDWKANECRSFLIYYSVIIFARVMKPQYFQHWLLLVNAVYILLQDSVSEADIQRADVMLKMFCRNFSKLYGAEHHTYYIHQISHLALLVKRYGPLHCNSAFMFESFNGTLAKYVHGTKNQALELVNNIRLAMGVEILKARCSVQGGSGSGLTIQLKEEIKGYKFNENEIRLFSACNKDTRDMKVFKRCVMNEKKLTCCLYTRQRKRQNYTISYETSAGKNVFGEIKYFCSSVNSKLALVELFFVDHCKTFCHEESGVIIKHIVPITQTGYLEVIDVKKINFKVLRIENFICLRPNRYEYNL